MANYDLLVKANLVNSSNPPSQSDIDFINNNLNQSDVQGLINVFQAAGAQFLVRNCNGAGGTVAPGPGRSLGIVF